MTKMRLTALSLITIALITVFVSCRRDDVEHQNLYMKTNVVLSGAQETPGTPTSATGTMDVSYSRLSKTLSYTVRWSGLTGPVASMHIHGLAPAGFAAPVFQTFTVASIRPCTTGGPTSCGSYTGTLFIDGVAVKEADLLNGMYYVNIHTATYPGGEIRGQIVFQ